MGAARSTGLPEEESLRAAAAAAAGQAGVQQGQLSPWPQARAGDAAPDEH